MSKKTESGREIFAQVAKKIIEVDMSVDYSTTEKGLEEKLLKAYAIVNEDKKDKGI